MLSQMIQDDEQDIIEFFELNKILARFWQFFKITY